MLTGVEKCDVVHCTNCEKKIFNQIKKGLGAQIMIGTEHLSSIYLNSIN